MKAFLAFLALAMAMPAVAVPTLPRPGYQDASELLAWAKKARKEVNRAGRAHDVVALSRIKREADQWTNVWYYDKDHEYFHACYMTALDLSNFLRANENKDRGLRERMTRQFRDDLPECERLVRAY